jgi:hypothetical protein
MALKFILQAQFHKPGLQEATFAAGNRPSKFGPEEYDKGLSFTRGLSLY